MSAELQSIVDALAHHLDRPLVVEDRQQRMVAYSQHSGPMDQVRRDSILRRETTPAVISHFRKCGIAESTDPLRIPGCDELEMLPRVCIPIRHRDLLLGFLWFIDRDESMTASEIATAVESSKDLALALYRANLSRELSRQREIEATRNLLVAETAVQAHASRELIEGGHFTQAGAVAALVALPVRAPEPEPNESLRTALEDGLTGVRRCVGPRESLHLVRFDHGLVVVSCESRTGSSREDCARELLAAMETTVGREEGVERIGVGIGSSVASLEETRRSYKEALLAAQVAGQIPSVGPVAGWEELGVYRALVQLARDEVGTAMLHPGLNRLLADEGSAPLVETLEVYLDFAGNAQRTAERLFLHRTTLYYRLQRISELTGADLRNGNDRLVLHLGLKLMRLNRSYEMPARSGDLPVGV